VFLPRRAATKFRQSKTCSSLLQEKATKQTKTSGSRKEQTISSKVEGPNLDGQAWAGKVQAKADTKAKPANKAKPKSKK